MFVVILGYRFADDASEFLRFIVDRRSVEAESVEGLQSVLIGVLVVLNELFNALFHAKLLLNRLLVDESVGDLILVLIEDCEPICWTATRFIKG